MDEAIRNVARWASVSPAQAIRMATEVPAKVLRRDDIGVLRPGAFADLTLFDHHLNVVRTIVDGLTVFSSPG
jgi:N-acetylglucosamine-6-phosphate deacetylase